MAQQVHDLGVGGDADGGLDAAASPRRDAGDVQDEAAGAGVAGQDAVQRGGRARCMVSSRRMCRQEKAGLAGSSSLAAAECRQRGDFRDLVGGDLHAGRAAALLVVRRRAC